ncbi:MAG: thioesterase [Cyclobacteriaceae bacterium]
MKVSGSLVLHKRFTVTTADADCFGRLRPGALINFMLQAAVSSADELGFGLAYLKENKLFWVLSRLSLEVYDVINWQDELEVLTWPRDTDRLYYLRDFVVQRPDGFKVAAATSAWLALDNNSKRPVQLDSGKNEVFTRLKNKSCGINDLPKLQTEAKVPDFSVPIVPLFSEFDLNGHVTTTRYIDWAMDTFSFRHHKQNYLSSVDVNFLKEVLPDETLTLQRFKKENGFLFWGILNKSNRPAYALKAGFKGL